MNTLDAMVGRVPGHKVTRIVRDDGTRVGYRCNCGGWWKVYQKPYHINDKPKISNETHIPIWKACTSKSPRTAPPSTQPRNDTMKKQPTAKLPKATVTTMLWSKSRGHYQHAAWLPAATKAQARQMVKAHKFLGMTREEQDRAIRDALANGGDWSFGRQPLVSDLARAVLATLYGEANK